ncbi:MAG: tail fiber protein [Flavobacteriales bacterium]
MKNIFTTCFFSLMIINTFGQVSIGNENTPNSEVILDLSNSDGKGLLLPKKYSSVTEPLGNIFYNSSKNMIGVVDSISGGTNVVNYLSPWRHTDANSDVTFTSDIGKVIITNTDNATDGRVVLEVQDGSINVQDGKIKEYGHDLLPQGAIIMWSGNTAPDGWALCDGGSHPKEDGSGNVTVPNLKGRFIVGYDPSNADYNTIGNLGGSKIMSHTHGVNPPNRTTTAGGAHSHNGITAGPVGSRSVGNNQSGSGTTVPNTAHTHIINDEPDHTHDLDIPKFTSDTASNNENRPPYWTLAFIMKK